MSRIVLPPDVRRSLLQRLLLQQYQEWPTFHKAVTEDIQPRWGQVLTEHEPAGDIGYHALIDFRDDLEDQGTPVAGLDGYIEAVKAIVADMGVQRRHAAAEWALEGVHAHATSSRPMKAPAVTDRQPTGWALGHVLTIRDYRGDHRAAHAALERLLDQADGERAKAYKKMKATGNLARLSREIADLPDLREHLSASLNRRVKPVGDKRLRFKRLAAVLDIDLPSAN